MFIQGVITTSKDLDREAPGVAVDEDGRGVYTLLVDATDHGSPKQRTTATVISQSSFVYESLKLYYIYMILVHAFIDKRFDGSAVPSSFAVNGNQN